MPDVFDIWMRLLTTNDETVLWLLKKDKLVEHNLKKEAQRRGVDPNRLIFTGYASPADHLARHRLADLFLDTFNCNAHTTASDALWAGLPLLTKLGGSFASRVAGSLLHAVGLPELITFTDKEYQDVASMLANDRPKLQVIKERLSRNRNTSELFDGRLFARHIEAAFMHMSERSKAGLEPDHFYVEN